MFIYRGTDLCKCTSGHRKPAPELLPASHFSRPEMKDIGLTEVVPEPVEQPDFVGFPPKKVSWITRIISYLRKAQKYSAYGLVGFLGIHLTSVIGVPGFGVNSEIAQEIFEMGRNIYHGIPFFEEIGIIGCGLLHVCSGMGARILTQMLKRPRFRKNSIHNDITNDGKREDIGLGGLGGIIGLGYKRSTILKITPNLNPISFSGYVLIPFVVLHWCKFRYLPLSIDEDSSLINLNYITYVLNISPRGTLGNYINFGLLMLLVWCGLYHFTSGMLRFNHKFSMRWKRIGYAVIYCGSLLSLIAITRMKRWELDTRGFIGKQFVKYINAFWV